MLQLLSFCFVFRVLPVSRLVQVEEPDGDTPATLSLVVQRLGGRVGVVEVAWNVTPINTDSGRFQQENTT